MNQKSRILVLLSVLLAFCGRINKEKASMTENNPDSFALLRKKMVDEQIRRRGVKDSLVLKAMLRVPRHHYVPEDLALQAYEDEPLPIGYEQTISQPYIVAYMTEALRLKGDEKVLEIGTGSGYQAAILAEIVRDVYTIEIVEPLAVRAENVFKTEGLLRIHCRYGDGYRGWPEAAPFDAIIVTAAPTLIPKPLIGQLKEGGRMILPVGDLSQELVLLVKQNGGLLKKSLLSVRFVPMTGEAGNSP